MARIATERPEELVSQWLTNDWAGELRPLRVDVTSGEDWRGRESWYFHLILPDPVGDTWDPDAFAEIQRAIRDKALEVGLSYPWYVLPEIEDDDTVYEDDFDPWPL